MLPLVALTGAVLALNSALTRTAPERAGAAARGAVRRGVPAKVEDMVAAMVAGGGWRRREGGRRWELGRVVPRLDASAP